MKEQQEHSPREKADPMARDPVCGMAVASDAGHQHTLDGITYLFCCSHCLDKFKQNPASYPGARDAVGTVPQTAAGTVYICLMDPEVHQEVPGSCPKCGMALEPEMTLAPLSKTEFTCPMHPEVVRDEAGSCPICGMALEPRTVTVEEQENPELVDMQRRFWISAVLTIPLVVIAMGDLIPGQPLALLAAGKLLGWLELALATPVVLWGGWPFFVRFGLRW